MNPRKEIWAYVSLVASLGAGLLLMAACLSWLARDLLAFWLLFQALIALAILVDYSVETTLARYVAYARSGLQALPGFEIRPSAACGDMDPDLLAGVLHSARRLCGLTALTHALLLGGLGTAFLHVMARKAGLGGEVLQAWALFLLGHLVNTRLGYFNPVLQGLGRIDRTYVANTAYRVLFAGGAILGLGLTHRLVWIGVANLSGAVVSRLIAYQGYRSVVPAGVVPRAIRGLSAGLLRSGWRLLLANLGGFMILKANVLLVSYYLGLAPASAYALAVQLFEVIAQFSHTPLQYNLPTLYALWAQKSTPRFLQVAGRSLVRGQAFFLILAAVGVATAPALLKLLAHREVLPAPGLMLLMALLYLLEMNHGFFTTLLLVDNQVPFLGASVLSGLAIVASAWLALATGHASLLTVILIQFTVQLAYNNWRWPTLACRRFGISYPGLLRLGAAQ
jgi:O-antigen/teichoic acid export membrane protein